VPIINIENGERVQLESLKDDIQTLFSLHFWWQK
jgi:hypothetical protein